MGLMTAISVISAQGQNRYTSASRRAKGIFCRQGAEDTHGRSRPGAQLRYRSLAFKRGEDFKELGYCLNLAFGDVSEKDRLEVLIQWLKTDEAVLPATLGGPIRSALARER